MITEYKGRQDHERFRELAALAVCGVLTPLEWSDLKAHLRNCSECREACQQYQTLTTEGMPALSAIYSQPQEEEAWDDTATRKKLLARVRASQQSKGVASSEATEEHFLRGIVAHPFSRAALAACLVLAVGFGAYRQGARAHTGASEPSARQALTSSEDRLEKLATEKKSLEVVLANDESKLALLRRESSAKEQELTSLRSQLRTGEGRSTELMAAKAQAEGQLRAILQERELLNAKLREADQAYQNVQAELTALRAERAKAQVRTASLESKAEELTAINREQDRRLRDDEQYLAADRDIRELMGARKLYIADVFDVDSGSRTRKPFGRVFYTQDKSLVFYAFDLDRQPGIKNANTFQVWGRRDAPQGEQAQPMNLGILYMDNESNRRWVMRSDDPKQLAEIDAVFVTVEPHGGSLKPTTKPFLYALLRKEANHP
jgi:hypothetical protein